MHNKALTAAGLPALSLHGLRRSFGTLANGWNAPRESRRKSWATSQARPPRSITGFVRSICCAVAHQD
jgi:hypothetical protein